MIRSTVTIPDLAMSWVINNPSKNSCTRKVIIAISDVAWTALSAYICIPSVIATLSEAEGSAWNKVFGYGSACGTGLDWFVLTTYGGVVFIHSTLQKKSLEEEILFKNITHPALKAVFIATSLGLGLASRAPAITEAIKFNKNKVWGKVLGFSSAVGEAGLPALGQYLQFEFCRKYLRIKFTKDRAEKTLEKIRQEMIAKTRLVLKASMKTSLSEREIRFIVLYKQQTAHEINHLGSSLTQLCTVIQSIYDDYQDRSKICEWAVWPRRAVQVTLGVSCVGLFILDALLARTAYQELHAYSFIDDIGMALAVSTLLYVVPSMSWDAAGQNFNLIYDLFGNRDDKSFADEFYPKLSKLLKLLCGMLSILQFDENIALTKLYVPIDSIQGRLLSVSNIVSCSLLISAAYYYLIDNMLETYSTSSFASNEIQHAAELKVKLERFIEVLQNVQPVEFAQMLKGIEDGELRRSIMNRQMTNVELINYLRDHTNEEEQINLLDRSD